MSTEKNVEFNITFNSGCLNELLNESYENNIEGVEKYLKLYTSQTTTNMHLFNDKEQLRKYNTIYEIVKDYFDVRYEYYKIRKDYLIDKLTKELLILSNKARFIKDNLDDKIDLRKKSKDVIDDMLVKMKFDKHVEEKNFNYLIKMPMDSVSQENVDKLLKDHENKQCELDKIQKQTIENMWLTDLNELKKQYKEFIEEEFANEEKTVTKPNKKSTKK
mgnify:FL=1